MRVRERTPLSVEEVRAEAPKPLRFAALRPGAVYRGRVVTYALGEDGERYAVLDTGRHWTAVPTERADLAVRSNVVARAQRVEREGERRQLLAWQLDDEERQRARGHDRER